MILLIFVFRVRDTFAKLTLSSIDVDSMQCDGVECFPRILSWSEDCSKDYVRVYDGSSTSNPVIATICGRAKSKQQIVASSPLMLVEFVTSEIGSLTNYGFEFRAAGTSAKPDEIARPTTSCDVNHNLLNTDRVDFHSIKHWYPKNTTCSYGVSGMPHELLEITFYEFQAGKDSSFCTNYLMIYDSLQPDPKKVIVQLCEMNPPRSKILTTGPNVLIVFHSEDGSLDGSDLTYSLDVSKSSVLFIPFLLSRRHI